MIRRLGDRAWSAGWILVPVTMAVVVWLPITDNYFFADDLQSVYDVVNQPLLQLLLLPYGGHLYIARNAIYAGLYALFGPDPRAYYWVALLTHVANVGLLCLLIRAVTGSRRLACFGAVLWGTTPVAESTIGWYSVYGHALATTGLLIIVHGSVRAGQRQAVTRPALAGWMALAIAISTCFGVGLAFAVLVPLCAWLLMPPGGARRRTVAALGATAVAVPLLYFGSLRLAAFLYKSTTETTLLGDLAERMYAIADLALSMAGYGARHLVLGAFAPLAAGTGATLLVSAAVLIVLAAGFWRAGPSGRRAMLAFGLLVAGTYGVIAAGRSAFYEYIRDLLVRTDRYQYSATAALAVLICLAFAQLAPGPGRPWARTALLGGWLLATATGLVLVRVPYDHFEFARRHAEVALAAIDAAIAATPPGEDVYLQNQTFRGVGPFVVANPVAFPGWAAVFAVFHPTNVVDGRRVFFVEADAEVRAAAAHGRRSAPLIIAPDDVPPPARVRQLGPAPR